MTIDPVTLTGEEVEELRRLLVFITLGDLSPRAAHSAWAKLGLNNDIRVSAAAAETLPPDSTSCMACDGSGGRWDAECQDQWYDCDYCRGTGHAQRTDDCWCGHPRSQHWGSDDVVACHQSMPPLTDDGGSLTCGCWNYIAQ